jgi:hypothetical protein
MNGNDFGPVIHVQFFQLHVIRQCRDCGTTNYSKDEIHKLNLTFVGILSMLLYYIQAQLVESVRILRVKQFGQQRVLFVVIEDLLGERCQGRDSTSRFAIPS